MAFDKRQTLLLIVIPTMSVMILCVLMMGNYIHLRDNDIYKQQTYAYENQLEVIMESQNRTRALRHDMKNHILAFQRSCGCSLSI